MKASDFNVYNIKEKYNFKCSEDFLKFLDKQLKIKEKDKNETIKLLEEIDYEFAGIEEEINDKEFIEFINRARSGVQKRLKRINAGIVAITQDLYVVKNHRNN